MSSSCSLKYERSPAFVVTEHPNDDMCRVVGDRETARIYVMITLIINNNKIIILLITKIMTMILIKMVTMIIIKIMTMIITKMMTMIIIKMIIITMVMIIIMITK